MMMKVKSMGLALCGVAALTCLNLPHIIDLPFAHQSSPKSFNEQGNLSLFLSPAYADVIAPQAPPELSDTLIDFRTKEQLSEKVYIEGKVDPQNSLNIPTVPGDLEAKVMRMSATYQAQYEIAVPRHGISIIRFYDLNGYPMDIVSTKLENQGFLAETTASPSELAVRQFQGASTTLMQVRLKGINNNFIFTLKPLTLVNQQSSVRTLITSMTVNYYVEGTNFIQPVPYKFGQPNPEAKTINYDSVNQDKLEQSLLKAAAIAMPLSKAEQEQSKKKLKELLN